MAFGRSVEASGPLNGGGRSVRPAEDEKAAEGGGPVDRNQRVEVKAEMLQRALANMRKKARFDALLYYIWLCSCFAAPNSGVDSYPESDILRVRLVSIYLKRSSNSH